MSDTVYFRAKPCDVLGCKGRPEGIKDLDIWKAIRSASIKDNHVMVTYRGDGCTIVQVVHLRLWTFQITGTRWRAPCWEMDDRDGERWMPTTDEPDRPPRWMMNDALAVKS